ncbi:MAG: hydantoinase/oxoprolinase family protein, partial [Chromatiales bacterium]|nr:hydantoinase/oxoprolinase family protein [Chromatiales bacterium]
CYGQGGTAPTVTDADVVLGRIDPDRFADGKIQLAGDAAAESIDRDIGQPLAMSVATAAAGIAEIVDETMASAARVHAVENGKDTNGRMLIATGGAAPLHAARLAQKLGIDSVVVPVGAGVGSAHGFLHAPIGYEVVRTRFMRLEAFDSGAVNELFAQMRAEAEAVVRLGAPETPLGERREAFMRYRGQGHEITVTLPLKEYVGADSSALRSLFDEQYMQVFGRVIPGLEVEVITWALTLATEHELPGKTAATTPKAAPTAQSTRRLFDPGTEQHVDAAVYARDQLEPGMQLAGPAVIVEPQTATVVPPNFSLSVDQNGHLILTREARI